MIKLSSIINESWCVFLRKTLPMFSSSGSLSFYSSWNWHKHWIPISPYSTECCSDVPVPAYPPEVSPSLLHLEQQHCSDRCLSPAAHHQLFTWSALLLIRWVIWGVRRAGTLWNLRPKGSRKGKGGSHLQIERERERVRVHGCGITDLYI